MPEPPRYTAYHTWDTLLEPMLTVHEDGIAIHDGPHGDVPGYCLRLEPRHLPILRRLVAKLEEIERKETTDA